MVKRSIIMCVLLKHLMLEMQKTALIRYTNLMARLPVIIAPDNPNSLFVGIISYAHVDLKTPLLSKLCSIFGEQCHDDRSRTFSAELMHSLSRMIERRDV